MAENQVVSFNYGLKKDLPEKQEGQLLFATDSKQIYVDINNTRHNFGLVRQAEDNESLIIGDGRDNVSGTKGFIIEKAQRITQDDGTYKYYYILRDSDDSLINDFQTVLVNYPQATYKLCPRAVRRSASRERGATTAVAARSMLPKVSVQP